MAGGRQVGSDDGELERLDPEPRAARGAREVVGGLGLDGADGGGAGVGAGDGEGAGAPGRPRVVAAMIASADGRAAVAGRSVALGHPADRALLRELRTAVDAILVGTATLAAERYANLLDADQRAARAAAGRPEHPLVATISRRLTLPVDTVPLFDEPGVELVAFTSAGEEVAAPEVGARLEIERLGPDGLTLPAVLDRLGARGVRSVLCEGGPNLLRRLVADGLLDDLMLTVSPLLVAGPAPSILEGDELDGPPRLALREVHRSGDHVFLHYGAGS